MKLDKNYNVKSKNLSLYENDLSEFISLIIKARDEGKITPREARLVTNIILRKQLAKDIEPFNDFLSNLKSPDNKEKQSMFIQLKTNKTTYV